jgi:hypothetical protein
VRQVASVESLEQLHFATVPGLGGYAPQAVRD